MFCREGMRPVTNTHIEGRVCDRITTQTTHMANICVNEPCHVYVGAKG